VAAEAEPRTAEPGGDDAKEPGRRASLSEVIVILSFEGI
jgi:hypothetical protein